MILDVCVEGLEESEKLSVRSELGSKEAPLTCQAGVTATCVLSLLSANPDQADEGKGTRSDRGMEMEIRP